MLVVRRCVRITVLALSPLLLFLCHSSLFFCFSPFITLLFSFVSLPSSLFTFLLFLSLHHSPLFFYSGGAVARELGDRIAPDRLAAAGDRILHTSSLKNATVRQIHIIQDSILGPQGPVSSPSFQRRESNARRCWSSWRAPEWA